MDHDELISDLLECVCLECKNIWLVPNFGDELSYPVFCPFCGIEFNYLAEYGKL